MAYDRAKWEQRRTRGKILSLCLILYALLVTVFSLYIPLLRGSLLYLVPYAFLSLFLAAWFDPGLLVLILAVLPLLGWIIRQCGLRLGKYVIVAAEVILLAMNLIITPFHLILGLSTKDTNYMALSALLAIPGVIVPTLILWAVHCWDPS